MEEWNEHLFGFGRIPPFDLLHFKLMQPIIFILQGADNARYVDYGEAMSNT